MPLSTCEQLLELDACIGYFEEPEPGVPVGCSGWYHSHGQHPLRMAQDVFHFDSDRRNSMVKPGIAGPFLAKEAALTHMLESQDS